MAPINGLEAFRLISAGHEIPIGRHRLEAQYLGEDVGRDGHPAFATFRKKVLLRPIYDADNATTNPMCAGIENFDISKSQPRK